MNGHGLTTIEEVLDHITGYWRSAILWAASDLNMADHVLDGRDTAGAIAAAEQADERAVRLIMDALCALGFADKSDGHYRIEDLPATIVAKRPGAFGESAPAWFNQPAWKAWGQLREVAKTGQPVIDPMTVGHEYFELSARASFNSAQVMGAMALPLLHVEPGAGTRIIDIACGSGGIGYAIATVDPTATVIGIDGDAVLAVAREYADELDIGDRVTHVPGDVTQVEFGVDRFDLAIASHVLHWCRRDDAAAIVERLGRSVVPGGRILIHEFVPDDERRRATHALMYSVFLLLNTAHGGTYTLGELSEWLIASGFENIKSQPALGNATAIVATRRR